MERGRRFCLLYTPPTTHPKRGAILFVHSFAEEMNKSRRIAALQARAFADAGWTVLQIDLFGCGDSSGDFVDATWQQWTEDVVEAANWLQRTVGTRPILWGIRTGCLLLTYAALKIAGSIACVFWQPVTSGKQFLRQFLRLKIANQLNAKIAQARISTEQLHDRLVRGETIEIAGYALTPALALAIDAAELAMPDAPTRVAWLEVSTGAERELGPASRFRVDVWRQAGHEVDARIVEGHRFWQTVEIYECAALIEATLSVVESWET